MKYRGFLLATAGGLAVAPGAQAADMLVKAPLMPVASWTGWYIGGHVGAAWQSLTENPYGDTVKGSTVMGGGQIGYNWQHGASVFGVEADISGFGSGPSIGGGSDAAASTSAHWLSTVRGRMGLAVADTMVYATGGVAFGSVKNSMFGAGGNTPGVKSETKTKAGWTVGGGIEHMWDAHWTIGLEGLFVDLGKSTVTAVGNQSKTGSFTNQLVIGRFKVNYKF